MIQLNWNQQSLHVGSNFEFCKSNQANLCMAFLIYLFLVLFVVTLSDNDDINVADELTLIPCQIQ